MNQPLVSVIMPVYNREKYVGEAIESVLNQTYEKFELIIIDDGSTDKSVEIIESYKDPRIRFFQNENNMGIVFSRNRGLDEAKGEYIAMLDSDDIAYPIWLQEEVAFLEANKDFVLVSCLYDFIDAQGKFKNKLIRNILPEKIPSLLLFSNCINQSGIMLRKSMLGSEKYRPEFPVAEDYDLWVRLLRKNKGMLLQRYLVKYRIHNSISSQTADLMQKCTWEIKKYQLIENLHINADEIDIDIHESLVKHLFKDNINYVAKAEKWLSKLINANQKTNFYNNIIFNIEVLKYWLKACYYTYHSRQATLLLFLKSELIKYIFFKDKVKFILSSIFIIMKIYLRKIKVIDKLLFKIYAIRMKGKL